MEKTIKFQGETITVEILEQGPTLLPDGRCVAFNGVLAPSVVEAPDEVPADQE